MSSYVFVPIIALSCYMFLLISFLPAKKNAGISTFMELLLSMVAWSSGSLFMRLNYWPSMEFWYHISLGGLLFLPVILFRFLRVFLGEKKLYHMPFWAAAILTAWLFNWKTGLLVDAPKQVAAADGAVAYVYDLSWAVLILFILVAGALWQSIRILHDNRKENLDLWNRLAPIWVGIGFLVMGNVCLTFPFFKGFPIDLLSGIPMAACLYYALYKKRVLQLDLLTSKANCYVVAFLLTSAAFYRLIPSLDLLIKQTLGLNATQSTMMVSLLVVSASWLLYLLLKSLLDALFIKEDVKYSGIIGDFSKKVSQLMGVEDILSLMMDSIRKASPTESIYFFLSDDNGDYRLALSDTQDTHQDDVRPQIPAEDHILNALHAADGQILMREYTRTRTYLQLPEKERQRLSKNRIECVTAVRDEDRYLGLILLGPKVTGKKYRMEELNFLSSISSIASIAIRNSRLYETAYQEARRDYLTGVANRKYFYEMLQKCCTDGQNTCGCLMMISVDDFRLYNQLYGSDAGDDVLKRIAGIICSQIPSNGFVARYGGKEFAVLLPGHSISEAEEIAACLSARAREMNINSGEYAMKVLTVSCGIARGVCPMPDYHELVRHAEAAVYYAKKAGKNRTIVYTEGETDAAEDPSKNPYQTDIYSSYAATVYALTAAIDAKDHYTFRHSENVACYARELARAYKLNEEGIRIVYEAGLLHDIGKIGIDEGILNKPGRLSADEYEVIKEHVELSIGIIRHLPSLDYVAPAVLGHHERYDGKGYPRALAGEEIPLMARILCIADSFDAMVSERSYKPRMEVDRALQILEEQAGAQFDPRLVSVFVKIVKDGTLKIR